MNEIILESDQNQLLTNHHLLNDHKPRPNTAKNPQSQPLKPIQIESILNR